MQGNIQSVADVAREAKGLSQSLKDNMKDGVAWDSEVDFQRRKLRTQYLKLLLSYPFSRESKDAETNLWMQTSYLLISYYKQRIASLDRTLFSSPGPKSRQNHGGNHAEYHKLLNRFRQFLAEEAKFYDQLLVRFVRQFDLDELRPVLVAIKSKALNQEQVSRSEVGRNQFPPEDGQTFRLTPEQRETKLAAWSKLLVCMGDIERYREQYNESDGRPRAGHEEGSPRKANRGGKNGATHEPVLRPRNYSKAKTIYEQARRITPDDGNASHQLAILASYQKDVFGSLLHYYRSVCVRSPYDPASENLAVLLRKALEQYKSNRDKPVEPVTHPRKRVDLFKEAVVVLHGIWVVDTSDSSQARASRKSASVIQSFSKLIAEALLPEYIVSDTVVLALGALWKQRMVKNISISAENKYNNNLESLMVKHILELTCSLMRNGIVELAEKPEDVLGSKDLYQHITVSLRRTIQGLRIMSKWVVSNISYIESSRVASAATPEDLASTVNQFLETYAEFFSELVETFPPQRLPELRAPLEEDVFMHGFSPIKRGMFIPTVSTIRGFEPGQSQVHPNDEYLMRISDLIQDARNIRDDEKSSIKQKGGRFIFIRDALDVSSAPAITSPTVNTLASIQETHPDPPRIHDSDDDTTTQATQTEEDLPAEALRETVDKLYDEGDEDEIVFNPRMDLTPSHALGQRAPLPISSPLPAFRTVSELTPNKQMTAEDLLNSVLHRKNNSGVMHSPLFSGGTIWSTDKETFASHNVVTYTPTLQRHHYTPGHGRSQSLADGWSVASIPLSQDPLNPHPGPFPSTSHLPDASLEHSYAHHSGYSVPYSPLRHAVNDGVSSHMPVHPPGSAFAHSQEHFQAQYPMSSPGFGGVWDSNIHQPLPNESRPDAFYQWGGT